MNFLLKAKKYEVGTKRKRKSGWWLKDKPGHWVLLREHVRKQYKKDLIHSNHPHAKLMQRAAAQLIRHFASSRLGYSRSLADTVLNNNYKDSDIKKFGLWKKRTLDAVEKYLSAMGSLYGEKTRVESTKTLQNIGLWQEKLKDMSLELKSQTELDAWVSYQFKIKNKPVSHVLYAARQMLGPDTPLSQVPDHGFKGFCKAIITKLYEHGPAGLSTDQIKTWQKAFETVFERNRGGNTLVPLAKALNSINSNSVFRNDAKWFVYCCTRYAMKNDGMVDLSQIPAYIQRAKKYHGTKSPPSPTYDQEDEVVLSQIRLGLLDPKKAAIQRERMYPTKMQEIQKIYMRKKRIKKSLLLAGNMNPPETSGPREDTVKKVDDKCVESKKKGKIKRMFERLLQRRPDLKEKYGS